MEFVDSLKKEANKTFTENGAVGFSSTGKALVDFNFKLPSFRSEPDEVRKSLLAIIDDRDSYLFKYLFYLRDCRGGIGERDTFRTAIVEALRKTKDCEAVIKLIPEYGRWDDLLVFAGTEFEDAAFALIKDQFVKDLTDMKEGKPVTLLAKWLPSDNASSKKSRFLAHKLAKYFEITVKEYRASVVSLRKYIDVLEVKACANRWSEIDYNKVPSNANLRYMDAFIKHDRERRNQYLKDLADGKEGVKMNSSTNFPHDIVHSYFKEKGGWFVRRVGEYNEAIEQLWKNLPDMPGLGNTLVVRDGSGSMTAGIGGTSVQALDVADALAIYTSSRCQGSFKDTFITFSSKPELVSLKDKETLHDKIEKLETYDDCSNTDLEATFDLILRTAINGKLAQEEMPQRILIISDMEFDSAHCHTYEDNFSMKSLMDVIADKYEVAGYKLPKLAFWNVNSRTNTIPMTENEFGLILVSGFSVSTINMVLSGEFDPYKALLSVLDVERYEQVMLAKY